MAKKIFILLPIFVCVIICLACQGKPVKYLTVSYLYSEGGVIEGNAEQIIIKGENATSVTAIPNEGYRFVKWSDDSTDNPRTDSNIQSNLNVTAIFEKLTFILNYSADENGSIDGETNQSILFGENSFPVTAVPNEGYRFVKWSDDSTDNPRTDSNIQSNLNVTAIFAIFTKTFTLKYANATENIEQKEITLTYFDLGSNSFLPTPQRINSIFEGWYLDKEFKTQVSDKDGNLVIDKTIFDSNSDKLYAKFSLIQEAKYNILMVYVTEVDAMFELCPDKDQYNLSPNGQITVKTKLTEAEKQLCRKITIYFEEMLNAMFAGLVEFNVDEYFTKEPMTRESFGYGISRFGYEYFLEAKKIPELKDKINNYDSFMVSVDLGQTDVPILNTGSGATFINNGCVLLEGFFYGLKLNYGKDYLEPLFNPEHEYYVSNWLSVLEGYIHEFTHTIEDQITNYPKMVYDYHDALGFYNDTKFERWSYWDHIGIAQLYLLRQAEYEGKKYGIPYDFWLGKRDDTIWDNIN